jgi:outer membrane receptor protein involved in Fe transport
MSKRSLSAIATVFAATVGLSGAARAQDDPAPDIDIEVPVLILDTGIGDTEEGDEELDLANIVQSAAKGVTTVQEAPAIVTVITGDDIYERGFTRLDDVVDTVPGWMRHDAIHNQFPFMLTRGTIQSTLYMHNGVSLFSPWENTVQVGRTMPLELVKRVELITGPGGVLWGANSYMGILNVITKDAEDVDGVETDVRYGDGPGEEGLLRGYVMAGKTEFLHDDVSVLVHAGFESYRGPQFEMPQHLFSTPLPQPNSQLLYGPLTESDTPRSVFFSLNGKLSVGAINVAVQAPVLVENHTALGFPGVVTVENLPEDTLDEDMDGVPDCQRVDPGLDQDIRNPDANKSDDKCVDLGRIARDNRLDWFDRYITADYRTRFADNKAGATFKVYGIEFNRRFGQLQIMAPSALLEGGLSFTFDVKAYRAGGSYDGDFELPGDVRLLYGGEAFREWIPNDVTGARQGAGREATVIGPYDLARIPLPCPREPDPNNPGTSRFVQNCPLTFLFQTDRSVLGAYVNPQWRPTKRLILDSGVRVQAAPSALGNADYATQLIFSGAAVVELAKNWHFKLNYAEGFRPPVFNNPDSNGESIQIDGSRELDVEESQSIQGELNARLFKGRRRIREVNFRADYSYTRLQNLIQLSGGRYINTADRGIHSGEFLGKIFLKGGHRVEFGYTYLKIATEDIGWLRAQPEHWFNVSGVYNLIGDRLQATTMIKVLGAMEDPNRIIEYRVLNQNPDPGTLPDENQIVVQPHEIVLDRLPPSAELSLGLTWYDAFGISNMRARLFAYNAFNARHYNPDAFHSYEPRLEFLPNPYPDFRFLANLNYTY